MAAGRRYISKQPAETFIIGVDLSLLLAAGETISVGASACVEEDTTSPGAVVTIMGGGSLQASADLKSLLVRIAGGTDGHVYKLSFRAATSADNLYEQDILVLLADL